MITWINCWVALIVVIFVGLTLYLPIKDTIAYKKGKIQDFDKIGFVAGLAISAFVTLLVVCIAFAMSVWYPFTNNEIEHGTYEYNQEYIVENIIYNERFNDGHSVFVNGKEFVCDEAIVKDVDDFKIMKSEYVWKNGLHKFFYDSIFFKEEQKYQLVIPEKYLQEK